MATTPSERTEAARPDRDLVQRCRRGDLGAFEDMYKRFGGRLYTVAYRITGSAADAEDLVQDIFLQAYRGLGTFRGEAALGTWLHRLAVNACLDFVRSKQGRRQRLTDTAGDLDALQAPAAGPWRPDAALDRMDLERAISQLPPSYRRAFLLHDVEGLEHHEAGKVAGTPPPFPQQGECSRFMRISFKRSPGMADNTCRGASNTFISRPRLHGSW